MNILIIGAHRGIGAALAEALENQQHQIIKTSRSYDDLTHQKNQQWTVQCDVSDAVSIQQMKTQVEQQFTHIDWLINCAGVLHNESFMPEKALSQINEQQMMSNYSTNAIGHLLLIQALEKLISRAEKPLVTSISARIGSIKDNHLGGWYAYRMSKAALNMGIKTLAIEWHRKHPKVKFLLLHPGTTDTDLSAPFQKRLPSGQLQTPELTAALLLEQMNLNHNHNSKYPLFLDHHGSEIQW